MQPAASAPTRGTVHRPATRRAASHSARRVSVLAPQRPATAARRGRKGERPAARSSRGVGHVARRLADQRCEVCAQQVAIETPARAAARTAAGPHVGRGARSCPTAFTARASHRTGAVIFVPDAPPPRPPLQRRFQVRPARHAFPALPAFRGPLRRFLRASLARGSPRASASRITAETDVCAASASAASAAAVAGSTVTRNCAEYRDSRLYRRCGCAILNTLYYRLSPGNNTP